MCVGGTSTHPYLKLNEKGARGMWWTDWVVPGGKGTWKRCIRLVLVKTTEYICSAYYSSGTLISFYISLLLLLEIDDKVACSTHVYHLL